MALRTIQFPPSSQITDINYDDDASDLFVTFSSGSVYKYLGVPSNVADEFTNALSAGKHLNIFVKGSYPYEKMS